MINYSIGELIFLNGDTLLEIDYGALIAAYHAADQTNAGRCLFHRVELKKLIAMEL